ncbi:DUF4352 domain-containing protein [Pleurocapsa sp. FMAR1]|uniref:DUF4352 domain-containing protein n=1 Tax=Pleurocapsa sp. FMAR1 TaxID=3040204 RepID=UPI0029C8BBE5|nr:DUF4352 domain-containing protein [Pleurocapsa sp. FMAR1]
MNYKSKKEIAQSKTTIFWIVLILLSLWLGWKAQNQEPAYSFEQYPTENNIIKTKEQEIKVSRVYITKSFVAGLTNEVRTAKGKYLVLEVDVTNTSKKTDSIEDHSLKLKDNQGRTYQQDFSVESDLIWNNKNKFDEGLILPGMTNRDLLAYDVLEDAQGVTLNYRDSLGMEEYTIPITQ